MLGASPDNAQASVAPRFYSVAEAARMFGVSPMTLYRAINDGSFPAVRIRGRLIVPAKAVEEMANPADGGQGAHAAASPATAPGGGVA